MRLLILLIFLFSSFFYNNILFAKENKEKQDKTKKQEQSFYGGYYRDNAKIVLIERNSTGKQIIDLNVNKIIQFKNIEISLIACWESKKDKNDHIALILIEEFYDLDNHISKIIEKNRNKKIDNNALENKEKSKILYYGWMFKKHKYINYINHPIIDIWVDRCF